MRANHPATGEGHNTSAGSEDTAIPDLPLTLVDPESGLEWQVTTIAERRPMAEAVAHCEQLNLAGFDDGRGCLGMAEAQAPLCLAWSV